MMFFEFTWKLIWLLAAWLPAYQGHTMDRDIADSFSGIFPGVVIVPLVLPSRYLWNTYVTTPGDRWR